MWEQVKNAVAQVAPTIGAALGGPLGGAAAQALSTLLTGQKDSTPKEIMSALSLASAEDLAHLKTVENDFKVKMASLGLDKTKLAMMDKDSARNREISLAKLGKRNVIMPMLALLNTVGMFGMAFLIMLKPLPQLDNDISFMLLGMMGGAFNLVMAYYFGSSNNADNKKGIG